MTVKTFSRIKTISFLVLFVSVIAMIYFQATFLIFISLGIYMVLISFLKTRVQGVLVDERQQKVGERAAQVSFKVLMPMLLLTSLALLAAGVSKDFHYLQALGIILSYVTCTGLIVYVLTYWYFDKRTGGR